MEHLEHRCGDAFVSITRNKDDVVLQRKYGTTAGLEHLVTPSDKRLRNTVYMPKPIRTETHALRVRPAERADVERTVAFYRRIVRLLSGIALTHWPELGALRSNERQMALEALFHVTRENPHPRYARLDAVLGKMPSYLRRAAIHSACGAVNSFLSNYSNWLDDAERDHGNRPPRLGFANVFPPLYGGNMILDGNLPRKLVADEQPDFVGPPRWTAWTPRRRAAFEAKAAQLATPPGHVRIKLLCADGQWRFSQPLKVSGRFKRMRAGFELSPSLVLKGSKVHLACPAELPGRPFIPNKHVQRVLSVDVGINTAATLAVVDRTGTVIARKFLDCGKHNDQRDKLVGEIAERQKRSHGGPGRRLGKGFCRTLYRRIAGLSLQAARELASAILAFAREHGVQALVIEDLKGFRPKGRGRKQRARFHRFQHRMMVKYLAFGAQEHGLRLLEVFARGTSRYAFDGSGKLKRDRKNAANATFANGKRFNADLNATYNIAARGWALLLKIAVKPAPGADSATGKSSGAEVRMPLVLADVWAFARTKVAAL